MTAALVLGGLLAVACVVFAARAFLREPVTPPGGDRLDDLGPLAQRQLTLAEERDRALAALKELEFDHRTGKVSDDDYRELVGPLRQAAAAALVALEPRASVRYGIVSEQPTIVPEPTPVPHEPPQQPDIPEPYPPPATPPQPVPVPEPGPLPQEPLQPPDTA